MKLTQNKKNSWKKINRVILRVDSVDLIYEKKTIIHLDCGFENISRGRCKLKIREKEKKLLDDLFIHTDKALMEVNIFYESSDLEKILRYFSYKKNLTRKIKIFLNISDSLMINELGDLYINNKIKIEIESISWNIPLL